MSVTQRPVTPEMDLTIRGRLPPSNGRKRCTTETRVWKKPETFKYTSINTVSNLRPGSVPARSPLWDENSFQGVQSTAIPLSARCGGSTSHSTHGLNSQRLRAPNARWAKDYSRSARVSTAAATNHIPPRVKHRQMSSRSHTDLQGHSPQLNTADKFCATHAKSDTDLLTRGRECDSDDEGDHDNSVDQMSSEIDNILQGISSGLIMPSPLHIIPDPGVRRLSSDNEHRTLRCETSHVGGDNKTRSFLPQSSDLESEPVTKVAIRTESGGGGVLDSDCGEGGTHEIEQPARQARDLRGLLTHKKEELNRSRSEEHHKVLTELESREQMETEKQRRRAAKMAAARQEAIEQLKKKREEKRQETQRIAHEEIALLQASGKIKKSSQAKKKRKSHVIVAASFGTGTQKLASPPQREAESQNKENERRETRETRTTNEKEESTDSKTPSNTSNHSVEEFFKAGPKRPQPASPKKKPNPQTTPTNSHAQADPGTAPTKSTMDGIFETLKQLEEPPAPLRTVDSHSPNMPSTSTHDMGFLTMENIQRLDRGSSSRTGLSDSKLQSILTYLDEVERDNTRQMESFRPVSFPARGETRSVGEPTVNISTVTHQEGLNQQLEAASAVANDVTTTIMTQRLEIENKNKTMEMLQKALTQQRELTVYHAKEMNKESHKRLELQKQEYEATIQRHQCFIDQLIDDKKALSDRCEQLIRDVRETDRKYKAKIKSTEDSHIAELEKLRQTAAAAEKLRRERWRADETQRIKEATVKSLEPEIQRIIAKGKAEIQKIKALHEAELLQADERASRRFLQQTEDLRSQFSTEKEQACQHERELARQKYEQLAEQEERSYQQLRRKLYSELQQERDRLAAEMHGQRDLLERQMKELKDSHTNQLERLKSEQAATVAETHRRHGSDLHELQERLTIEKQAWEENYMKKQDTLLLAREREMRDRLRRERDREIETVIQKLEEETAASKEECERNAESRIRRLREKYETELKEVERSERNALEKFNSMKIKTTELEGEVISLRSMLRQRQDEVDRVNEVATRLMQEKDRVKDIVRQEFADRLISVEEENHQVKLEMSELRARQRLELERVKRGKERELEEVHERVKQALARKEGNLKTLRSQHEAALKRADHLEMLLEQQRKELLK